MVESEPAKVTCSAAVPPPHAECLHSRHEQRGSHLCCQHGSNVAVPQLLSFRVFDSSADRCTVVLSFRQSHARAHSTTPTSDAYVGSKHGLYLCSQQSNIIAVSQLLSFRVSDSRANRCTVVLSFRQSHARATKHATDECA